MDFLRHLLKLSVVSTLAEVALKKRYGGKMVGYIDVDFFFIEIAHFS